MKFNKIKLIKLKVVIVKFELFLKGYSPKIEFHELEP